MNTPFLHIPICKGPLHLFLIITFVLIPFQNEAQESDSLKNKSYDQLKEMYYASIMEDSIKAKRINKVYLTKAKKERDTFQMAEGYFFYYYNLSSTVNLSYFDSIIHITQNNPSKRFPAKAYFRRAQYHLYKERDIEKTINDLALAKTYSNKYNNTILSNRIDYLMGIIRSEHLGEKEEAIPILKKCAKFYASLTNEYREFGKYSYLNALTVISETYIGLQNNDSAQYYNKLGYSFANKHKEEDLNSMKYFFTLTEGVNQYNLKNYTIAIDSLTLSLPKMIYFEDKNAIIDNYFYLGKSYYDSNEKEKAIVHFKKTDSILETLNSTPKYEYVKTYEYLKNYFTNIKDIKNQNLYLTKLNTVLDKYLNDKVFISKKVKEDYDVPQLLEEQKKTIHQLNKKNNTYTYGIIGLLSLLIGSIGLVFYQNRKRRIYRQRFEELINKQITTSKSDSRENLKNLEGTIEIQVPKKHINHILDQLDNFEKTHGYLSQGLSVQSLANEIETNVKYLSRVINHYKKKKFTTYINELRISYTVKELKENPMLRKYTIKAIADEMGYSSAETFSNAFYKQLAIKPSFFIKELEKTENK